MRTLLALLAISSSAYADGNVTFQVVDHGDSVEVIAHNLALKNANVSPIRSRLEVPVTGTPIAGKQMMQDSTVLQVELDGFALSVKTKLDRPEVHELAKLATATQVGDDVHLMFPRHAQIAPAATPTTTPTTVAATKPATATTPTTKPALAPVPPPAPAVAPAAVAPAAIEKPIAAPIPTPPPPAIKKPIPPEQRDWSGTGMYALAALGALGTAAYLMKKKQKATVATSTIDGVAQRTLGSKAKVVWLAAGQREMIVAVTGTQVRMLGQWPRGTTSAPVAELPVATVENVADKPVSPSVAGILKLRAATQGRTPTLPQIPAVTDDAEEPEADLEWAKEILTATGRR